MKKVNGCDAYGLKRSRINKATQVTRKGCRVTRDIGDCTSILLRELLYNIRSKSCTRRVNYDDIGIGVGKLSSRISADGINVTPAGVLQIASQVAHSRTV